jgi:LysM repeat protein
MKPQKKRHPLEILILGLLFFGILLIILIFIRIVNQLNVNDLTPVSQESTSLNSNSAAITSTSTIEPVITPSFTPTIETIQNMPDSSKISYVVNSGDTLSLIAAHFNIDVTSLKQVNGLIDDTILVGQTLEIPTENNGDTSSDSSLAADGKYIVQDLDTIYSIAEKFAITPEDIRKANFMIGDSFLVGQELFIPNPSINKTDEPWSFSVLNGDRRSAYPMSIDTDHFSLRYQANTFPSVDPESVALLVNNALLNDEQIFQNPLDVSFTAYVAGSLFLFPDQYLRGRSFAVNREFIFLHDGTGDAADQQYLAAHEFTHLYMWNVFGKPSSVLISEGAAVFSGMEEIQNFNHLPLLTLCKLFQEAGMLPDVSTDLSFEGHNYDLINYYTAGCFVKYLAMEYGPQSIGEVYPTSNYETTFSKNLRDLEGDFEVYLSSLPQIENIPAKDFSEAANAVSQEYKAFFPSFSPSIADFEKYRILDQARIDLLTGNIDFCRSKIEIVQGLD